MTMTITKAVITAAAPSQRTLPIQMLIDRDGTEKPVLRILIDETISAGIQEIAIVVAPGDEKTYAKALGEHEGSSRASVGADLTFIQQEQPLGYGHAIYCARRFTNGEAFLHLVGDHLYVSGGEKSCARRLVETAGVEDCAVSAVQPTRESLLPHFGVVGGRRVQGRKDLYVVETVIEKPTPTEAEQYLIVPGLRAGHYLCFFGMHVLTPGLMGILEDQLATANQRGGIALSGALARLAGREKYLALEEHAWRYDVGVRYGIFNAQLSLALSGKDRAEVLVQMLELLAQRNL